MSCLCDNVNFLLKILDDPSPSLLDKNFSPEFCSFVDACLQKDPVTRPTAEKVRNRFFGMGLRMLKCHTCCTSIVVRVLRRGTSF